MLFPVCPMLSPTHWSEDWVMLSLQAKPIKKSRETPLLCCQGFALKSHGSFKWCGHFPVSYMVLTRNGKPPVSPRNSAIKQCFLQLSEWQSSCAFTSTTQAALRSLSYFLIFLCGKSVTFRDCWENQACSWAAHFSTVNSVLVMASWVFRSFFFKPRLKDIIRHRNLVFTVFFKTLSFIFISLVDTLRFFICWWAFKNCRKARWCPGTLWLYSSALLKVLFGAILKDELCKESSSLLTFLICGKIQGHFPPWLDKDLYKASCQMFQQPLRHKIHLNISKIF